MSNYSSLVKMKPWVGENYENSNPKILIMGESLYQRELSEETIVELVDNYITNKCAFFTKIENIFSNPNHWDTEDGKNYKLDKEKFWHDIAFYEYIQSIMNRPKEKVPSQYWEDAKNPFFEVLEQLKPDIVIAVGYETYWNLPEDGFEEKIFEGKRKMYTWNYQIKGKNIIVCGIQHPSSCGFSTDVWIELFSSFLKEKFNIIYQ